MSTRDAVRLRCFAVQPLDGVQVFQWAASAPLRRRAVHPLVILIKVIGYARTAGERSPDR